MIKKISNIVKCFSNSYRANKWLERGNELYEKELYTQASLYYEKILKYEPDNMPACTNLGNIYFFEKKYAKAMAQANKVIRGFSLLPYGYSLRGRINLEINNYAAAVNDLLQAVKLDKTDYWNWNYLSQAFQRNGDYDKALDAAYQAVELSGGDDSQHLNMSYALYEIATEKGVNFVQDYRRKWQQKYAQNPIVEQSDKSFAPDSNFTKSNYLYVEKVFDNFALSFDEVLTGLGYDSPNKIATLIKRRVQPQEAKYYRILDIGCGTGLCAKALDSLFKKRFITGVDISGHMLEQASQKKCYNQLQKADIETFLQQTKDQQDIIVAADVLTYFGELEKVFCGVFKILKKGGVFAFSISQNTENNQDWFLHISGRFIHSKNYIETILKKCGFQDVEFEDSILRKEGEKDVLGWIISAQK